MFADVEYRNDRRMVDLRNDARLALEPRREARIVVEERRHQLERDLPAEAFLHREIYGRHSAATESALDLIARDHDRVVHGCGSEGAIRCWAECSLFRSAAADWIELHKHAPNRD